MIVFSNRLTNSFVTKKYNVQLILERILSLSVSRLLCAGLCKKQHNSEQNNNVDRQCPMDYPIILFQPCMYIHVLEWVCKLWTPGKFADSYREVKNHKQWQFHQTVEDICKIWHTKKHRLLFELQKEKRDSGKHWLCMMGVLMAHPKWLLHASATRMLVLLTANCTSIIFMQSATRSKLYLDNFYAESITQLLIPPDSNSWSVGPILNPGWMISWPSHHHPLCK